LKSSFYNFDLMVSVPLDDPRKAPDKPGEADLMVLWQVKKRPVGELEAFLVKILTALERTPGQDTIMALLPESGRLDLARSLRKWQISRTVVFGIHPEVLGMSVQPPLYQPFPLGNRAYLWADPLEEIEKERADGKQTKSRPLWLGLQQLLKMNS
jgi:hypothetical protein